MIDIKRKEDCVGCGACHDACPRDAIYWETDIEGFWYPRVNQDKCIECGLCEKVCPIIQSGKLNCTNAETPVPDVLAAYNAGSRSALQKHVGRDILCPCREDACRRRIHLRCGVDGRLRSKAHHFQPSGELAKNTWVEILPKRHDWRIQRDTLRTGEGRESAGMWLSVPDGWSAGFFAQGL